MHTLTIQTRRESFDKVLPTLGDRQKEVFKAIMEAGSKGISAWGIAEMLGCYVHSIRPRITELCKLGQVESFGRRICDKTGKSESIWRLSTLRFDNSGQGVLW